MTTYTDTNQLVHLIRELNNPRNQGLPERVYELQKQIQVLQRQPSAWQVGLDLLEHEESQLRFYGALTLTIKINADWDNDKVGEDRDSLRGLLERLVSSYVRLAAAGDATFVVQKLCTTLAAVFQRKDSAWAVPVRHVLACSIAGRYVEQNQVPGLVDMLAVDDSVSAQALRAVLLLAQTIAEDASTTAGVGRSNSLQVRLSNNSIDVWQLLHFSVASLLKEISGQPTTYRLLVLGNSDQFADLGNTVIQTVPYWTNDVKAKSSKQLAANTVEPIDQFGLIIKDFAELYHHNIFTDAVLQAFTVLEQNSHSLLRRAAPRYAEHILTSSQAMFWIDNLLAGGFDVDAVAYVDFLEAFMSQVDVTTPEYLQDPQHMEVLGQVQRLLSCDGIAGIEDVVCHVALEILSSVVEGYSDWPESSTLGDLIKVLVVASCSACLTKIRMPPEEMSISTQTWDSDDRAKFQDFRFDVQDYLQNAFGVLGTALIEEITRSLIAPEHYLQWHIFEADLFGLMAFADVMASEPATYDRYLEALFASQNWISAMDSSQNLPERVRQMMSKLLGESTGFLQRHTHHLVSSLDFLFATIHISVLATPASRAIFTLCDAQRVLLTETLPQFISSLSNISDLEPDARNRIFGGVSAIIQALQTESAKLQPLSHILLLIEANVKASLDTHMEIQDFHNKAADVVYTLAAIGKGLRAPTDTPEELGPTKLNDIDYWTKGDGSSVQRLCLQIYSSLQQKVKPGEDSTFVEATCEFLRSTFTEEHPSPFRFSSSTTVTILIKYLHPTVLQPDLVLGTASSYLASADIKDSNNGFTTLLLRTLQICEDAAMQMKSHANTAGSDFCAAALEFVARLLPKWGKTWLSLPTYQTDVRIVLETALLLMRDPDTLTRRSATTFCSSFLDASARSYITSDSQASSKMNTTLQEYGPRLLATLLHLLGGECARSEIDSVTEPLKRFVVKQPLMANRLIKETMKAENEVLSPKALAATKPELRARVASQIEILRGARKTNEILKDFWISCRGSSFGYVT